MERPLRILCAGMHRAGSTWLYNVVRFIYLNDNRDIYCSFATGDYNPANPAPVHILKIHRYDPQWEELGDYVLTTRRDLRDVAASAVRMGLVAHDMSAVIEFLRTLIRHESRGWSPRADLLVSYEEMIRDKPLAIVEIAKVLGVECDAERVNRQVEELRPGDVIDPVTMLHPNHFTDGGTGTYQKTLSEEIVGAIEQTYREWLITNGYLLRGAPASGRSQGSIIIVGNSAELLGRGLGEQIDAHDLVVRCNSFITQGFEVDVGRRTDCWALSTWNGANFKLRNFCQQYGVDLADFLPTLEAIWIPFSTVKNREEFFQFLQWFRPIDPSAQRKIELTPARVERRLHAKVKGPSTGLIATYKAMDRFPNQVISLVGFGKPDDRGPCHYYAPNKPFATGQNYHREHEIFSELVAEGKVTFL